MLWHNYMVVLVEFYLLVFNYHFIIIYLKKNVTSVWKNFEKVERRIWLVENNRKPENDLHYMLFTRRYNSLNAES